ncbi:MAG: chromosome segregation protein SMC [Candidatus Micrarchaeota archaeon]|nr:chromosome segregation protein SMC [Candidatus Micrarchaeota archaeon]
MLYLKSITLDKFKSFKHAELLFSKGFTCIVGPNGSGKSVIYDSLAVALGSPSPSELRVSSLSQLINNTVKHKSGEHAKAHVKLEFGGDQNVTVVKAIRSDSKTLYKLNGKNMSRREVIEFLSKNSVSVDDTTTIAQGAIDGISKLNSKQRRGLIDVAAGIKDVEEKKAEAIKELDKADQKISEANVMLNERQGFLRELEKEKEAAEEYIRMNHRVKLLRYSVLTSRYADLNEAFQSATKDISRIDAKKAELAAKRTELAAKRDQLNQESLQLQSDYNKNNINSGEIRAKLENLNNELSRLDVEIPSLVKGIDELNGTISQSNLEVKEAVDKIKANGALMEELGRHISSLDMEITKLGAVPEGIDLGADIEQLENAITNDENKLVDISNYISKLQADSSVLQEKKSEATNLLAELRQKKELLAKAKEEKSKAVSQTKSRLKETEARIGELDEQCANFQRQIDKSEEERITLMQQKFSISQSREGNIAARLTESFKAADGFYGKAANLCSYDSRYATAVETAASNRFEYFVVDSLSTATTMIEYLKKNNAGRATFIPINEINSDREQSRFEGAKPVIDLVKFDSKFSKVFNYIFSNTYLIGNPNDAKKHGIGRHRYVTLEGELIEPSGTISGGSQKGRLSLAAVENRLKSVTEENENLKKAYHAANTSMNGESKEYALLKMQLETVNIGLGEISNEILDNDRKISGITEHLAKSDSEASKLSKEIVQKDNEKLEIISSLNASKEARRAVHEKLMEATKGVAASKKRKAEAERLDSLRKEAEDCKVKRAELNTETNMLERKRADISKITEDKQKQLKWSKEQLSEKEVRKEVLYKTKSGIEKEINTKSESGRQAYSRIQAINDEVSKLSSEYGRIDAEINGFERQVNEIKLKRQTSETRLNDISAELKLYDHTVHPLKGKLEEMEAEVNVLSAKMLELGNVNLKAPEIYEEKKKMVDDAMSRMSTLQTEKDAVVRMIEEIDSKKLQTFMNTLNEVNKNFIKLYNYVYPGKACIILENEKDPLNSGIHIRISNGKSETQFMSMSGGERAIISLMLLFSIHLCKKSSLYIFDEVDAALDKENAKKLSMLIKEMSKEAQFIVISHNDSLIVNADTAIGVVKTEGESKAYGVDIASIVKK